MLLIPRPPFKCSTGPTFSTDQEVFHQVIHFLLLSFFYTPKPFISCSYHSFTHPSHSFLATIILYTPKSFFASLLLDTVSVSVLFQLCINCLIFSVQLPFAKQPARSLPTLYLQQRNSINSPSTLWLLRTPVLIQL